MTQAAYRISPFEEPLSVPRELASRRNWIGWRAVYDPGKAKPRKIPVVLAHGVPVKDYLRPHAHVSYEEALKEVGRRGLAGVGFVLTYNCGVLGGDLDDCRDPATGIVEPWAQEIVDKAETYSRSRRPARASGSSP